MERVNYIADWDRKWLDELIDTTGMVVLDVSAGTGRPAFAAARDALRVYGKERFASLLKGIWLTNDLGTAKQRTQELADQYRAKCLKAIETPETGFEDALPFLASSVRK